MIINNNMMATNANRMMGMNQGGMAKSIEKLSSGLRINRAGDDAAGLSISEKMRAQVRGLNQASKNSQDAISLVQTAEGALDEVHSMLQRMRELALQGANDTNVDVDRDAIAKEMTALKREIDDVSQKTEFNTQKLLDGNFGSKTVEELKAEKTAAKAAFGTTDVTEVVITAAPTETKATADSKLSEVLEAAKDTTRNATANNALIGKLEAAIKVFGGEAKVSDVTGYDSTTDTTTVDATKQKFIQVGANEGQKLNINIDNMDAKSLGVDALKVDTHANAESAATSLKAAIEKVSTQRSSLGAIQNRLEHTIKNLDNASENLQSAESRIRDTNMAKEMSQFTKNNILSQASQAMLAQANQLPQQVLQLLR